jgi:hypothetical protein
LITPQTESTPLPYFSPSVTSKKTKKPSQRRFLIFLLRLRKKTEKNRVNTASLFFSFGYVKKQKKTESTPLPCFSPSVM